jgi:hypothetical protein
VYVNNAAVIAADIQVSTHWRFLYHKREPPVVHLILQAQNGVIHLIDTVLIPQGLFDLPTLVTLNPQLQILGKVLTVNGLIPTLSS